MAFQYDPKDAGNRCIPDGEYESTVLDIEEQTSKAGNPMLRLTVKVWAHGETHLVTDYIVNPKSLWKLKKLSEAVGLAEDFASGKLDPRQLLGKNFLAVVKIRKDEAGKYPDQNVITRYSPSTPLNTAAAREPGADDDELRF